MQWCNPKAIIIQACLRSASTLSEAASANNKLHFYLIRAWKRKKNKHIPWSVIVPQRSCVGAGQAPGAILQPWAPLCLQIFISVSVCVLQASCKPADLSTSSGLTHTPAACGQWLKSLLAFSCILCPVGTAKHPLVNTSSNADCLSFIFVGGEELGDIQQIKCLVCEINCCDMLFLLCAECCIF